MITNRIKRHLTKTLTCCVAAMCCSVVSSSVLAQRMEFDVQYNSMHENQDPKVGTKLKNVQAFDSEGNEFELSALKGKYSVLVFGCLT